MENNYPDKNTTLTKLSHHNLMPLTLVFLMVLLTLPLGSSYFTQSHELWTLSSLQTVDSPLTQLCRDYQKVVVDSNTADDTVVIYYFSSDKQTSYISTHQKLSYEQCKREADTDEERCACAGIASHQIQDYFSHNAPGVVPKYLKKFGGLNFIGHMVIEKNFENKHLEFRKNDPVITSGLLKQVDDTALDSYFDEFGGNSELMELFEDVVGENIEVENTFRIFRSGYQNEGFFSTAYKDKVTLPKIGIIIPALIIGIGFLVLILMLVVGFKQGFNRWQLLVMLIWSILIIFAAIILISFITGSTWEITSFLIQQPARFGYLSVTDADMAFYDKKVQEATDEFFRTGQLPVLDASGLTYEAEDGSIVKGALIEAESTAKYVLFPFFLIWFALLNIFMFLKAAGIKMYRFINITGITLTIFTFVVVILIGGLVLSDLVI